MSAEWDDLARLAQAATPGPWRYGGQGWIFAPGREVRLDVREFADQVASAYTDEDGAWIAAANPATILRLIAENRSLRHTTEADLEYQRRLEARLAAVEAELQQQRHRTAEFQTIAAGFANRAVAAEDRLAAVEALADEWERRAALAESTADARAGLSDEVSLRQHAVVMSNRAHDLRAALAAPTDTTKEN